MNPKYRKEGQSVLGEDLLIVERGKKLITTDEYEAQRVIGEEVGGRDFGSIISQILSGGTINVPENALQTEEIEYPNGVMGKLRHEALYSIAYEGEKGIDFLVRQRPDLAKSNTPGLKDAGVIFHGVDRGMVTSPRRFIADMTGKNQDGQVTEKEVQTFLDQYGHLFEDYKIKPLGHLVLTNGNKAREEEAPMSALMQTGLIMLTREQVEEILRINGESGNKNYNIMSSLDRNLSRDPQAGGIVPKLEAFRDTLPR